MIRVPPGIHLLRHRVCRFSYTSWGAQDGNAHSGVRNSALVWGQGRGGIALLWMPDLKPTAAAGECFGALASDLPVKLFLHHLSVDLTARQSSAC